MLCALLVRHRPADRRNRFDLAAERGFDRIVTCYGRWLSWVLDHQALTLLVATLTVAATVAMYVVIPKGFFPVQDTGAIQGISEAAQDISFKGMVAKQQALADAILEDPAVASLSSFIGVDGTNTTLNAGRFLINLKPKDVRRLDVSGVIARLRDSLRRVPGVSLSMQPVQDLTIDSTVSRAQYHFFLENPDSSQFTIWVPKLLEKLQQAPDFLSVTSDMNNSGRALDITVDRATAARFGITSATIDNALYDAFGQRIVSTLYTQSNQYRVILQADVTDSGSLQQALGAIYLPSASAATGQVPLSAIVHLSTRNDPLQVEHLGQFPAVSVSFDLAADASLSAAVAQITSAEHAIGMPDSFSISFQGALSAFQSSLSNELLLVLAALVAVYVVLGVLYESFIHPLTILSTLPSAGFGALLGAVPLMLGTGSGSELRQPLGIAIVGGLLVSQLLTLFTTPVIYLMFDSIAVRLTGRRPSGRAAPAE
jgi:multidrug efflux pump